MKLSKQSTAWLGGIFAGVLAAWLKGFFNQFLPSPQRALLGIKNVFNSSFGIHFYRKRSITC